MDITYAKQHVKCNCGHMASSHYNTEGCCTECACTWYWPNDKWIVMQAKKIKNGQEAVKRRTV